MRRRLLLIAVLLTLSGCGLPVVGAHSGFALRYIYGSCIDYRLDTVEGTFTRIGPSADSPVAPVRVEVRLSPPELAAIEREMVQIGFFSYPEVVTVDLDGASQVGTITPHLRNDLAVYRNGVWTRVGWDEQIVYPTSEEMEKLRALGRLIRRLVEDREEVRGMPPPRGACL
jgi:hypothetical protein